MALATAGGVAAAAAAAKQEVLAAVVDTRAGAGCGWSTPSPCLY